MIDTTFKRRLFHTALFFLSVLLAAETAAKSARKVKVVVVALFELDEVTGDRPVKNA